MMGAGGATRGADFFLSRRCNATHGADFSFVVEGATTGSRLFLSSHWREQKVRLVEPTLSFVVEGATRGADFFPS